MSKAIADTAHYVTFKLGDELFAIDVVRVREILEISQITKVPSAPSYLRGVVNVRGTAIPVVDLRMKFGLPSVSNTVHTRIVVMELQLDGEVTVVGGVADSVQEVIELDSSQINPPPRIAMRWRTELIAGMGQRGDQFIIILDINSAFSLDEISAIEATAPNSGAVPIDQRAGGN